MNVEVIIAEFELTTSLVLLFWCSLAVLCYSYAGYPVLLLVAARFLSPTYRYKQECVETVLPRLTVLIVAYNAEHHIRERIKNILSCDYPSDRIEILIASDGSTDGTVSLVEELGHPNVRTLDCPQRRGKTITLVDAVRHISSDVILFTDATNHFDQDTIHNLLRHFGDPHIGIATGKVSLVDEQGEAVESVYWNMEMMLRRAEMRLGIMLGANGPIYAIRRKYFVEPNRPVINDDLVLPMLAHLRHGCGIVYDETARAYMLSSGGLTSEFRRRCRIGAGAYQSLPILMELFGWRNAKQAFAFASHKLMRWVGPFMLVILLITSVMLSTLPGYRLFSLLQATAYSLAVIGLFAPNCGCIARLARVASSFLMMNLALLTGFFRWIIQPQNVVWNPTVRPTFSRIPAVRQ